MYNRVVLAGRVDGAIVITSDSIEDDLRLFSRENMPCILVARKSDVVDSVYVNHELASKEAVEYLVGKGHQNIAVVTSSKAQGVMEDRVAGYKRALDEKGISYRPESAIDLSDDTAEAGASAVDRLLALNPRPTAVFCPAGDMAAVGIVKELRRKGISVPSGMAVVGYDDLPAAEVVEPSLTTVRQPKLEMGDYAISMIIDKIEGREKGTKHKELNAKLIVRESA